MLESTMHRPFFYANIECLYSGIQSQSHWAFRLIFFLFFVFNLFVFCLFVLFACFFFGGGEGGGGEILSHLPTRTGFYHEHP